MRRPVEDIGRTYKICPAAPRQLQIQLVTEERQHIPATECWVRVSVEQIRILRPEGETKPRPRRSVKLTPSERNYAAPVTQHKAFGRSEEHTSELQSLMRISYAVFCLKKKKK